jgi:hypothetical protein
MRVRTPLTTIVLCTGALVAPSPSSAAGRCPAAVPATARDLSAVVAFARRSQPNAELVGVLSLQVESIGTDDRWVRVATARCGARVASRSWVVFYLRPRSKGNTAFADGVSYITRTRTGYRVWYRYQ